MSATTSGNGPLRRAILLRHGRTSWNAQRRWQGWTDVPLDAVGLREAEGAASVLARDGAISVLVTSPLRRAVQTANVVAGAFDLAGRPLRRLEDARLREIDMGEWSGLTHDEVEWRFPDDAAAVAAGRDLPRGLTGETMQEASVRVRAGFDASLGALAAGECALIVMHGAVIRSLVAEVCGIPSEVSRRALGSIGNARWVELVEDDGGWHVAGWNLRA